MFFPSAFCISLRCPVVQFNSNRARGEFFQANGRPKQLKLATKIRVFDFGHVYYGNIRDVILDNSNDFWIQGAYTRSSDHRVSSFILLVFFVSLSSSSFST